MAKTASSMLPLGTLAPQFSLRNVITDTLETLTGHEDAKATVIFFICNHCPYVKHVIHELIRLAADYTTQQVRFLAINSNDQETYPDDSPTHMKDTAIALAYPFPYLFDETQEVARAYQATCTPDLFVFDTHLNLAYRGQLDDSRPGNNIPVTGSSVREALYCLLNNQSVSLDQKPSLGCNIKWRGTLSHT